MNRRHRAIILADSWQQYRDVIASHGLDGRGPSGHGTRRMRRSWESKGEPVAVLDRRQQQVTAMTQTNGGS